MKIIQHRVNGAGGLRPRSKWAEIDVHVDHNGNLIAKHDPDDPWPTYAESYVPSWDGFFVDIKQNLRVEYYNKIAELFGSKLIGLFDVPFPAAYFLAKSKPAYPVYYRYSELEKQQYFATHLWLDPIVSQDFYAYANLINDAMSYTKSIIVAAPSLHGGSLNDDKNIYWLLKNMGRQNNGLPIDGLVTKYAKELSEC